MPAQAVFACSSIAGSMSTPMTRPGPTPPGYGGGEIAVAAAQVHNGYAGFNVQRFDDAIGIGPQCVPPVLVRHHRGGKHSVLICHSMSFLTADILSVDHFPGTTPTKDLPKANLILLEDI